MKNIATLALILMFAVGVPLQTVEAIVMPALPPISKLTPLPTVLPGLPGSTQTGSPAATESVGSKSGITTADFNNASASASDASSCGDPGGGALGQKTSATLKRLFTNFGNELAYQGVGLAAQGLNQAIVSVTGNSSTGRMVGALLTGHASAGGIVSNILGGGGVGNAAGQLVNGALNKVLGSAGVGGAVSKLLGGGGLQSLLGSGGVGGAISKLLGGGSPLGIVSGLLGGGEVPVKDSEARDLQKKIDKSTAQTQKDQDAQLKKDCETKPAIAAARIAATAEAAAAAARAAATARDGGPIFETRSLSKQQEDAHTTILNDTVNNVAPNVVTQSLLSTAQKNLVNGDQSLQNLLRCPVAERGIDPVACAKDYNKCGRTATEREYTRMQVDLYQGCTAEGVNLILGSYQSYREKLATADRQQQLLIGQGYYPAITCPGGFTQEECLVLQKNYQITTTGSTQGVILNSHLLSGQRQQENANDIGTLVDNLFSELATTAFTSLKGVIGIALQNSSGQGSYADNLQGGATQSSLDQARNRLADQIQSSLEIEYSYQDTLAEMLINLDNTKNAYIDVRACYIGLSTGGALGIDAASATEKAAAASTTVQAILDPELVAQTKARNDSADISDTLLALQDQAVNAQTPEEIDAIGQAYQSFLVEGKVHTANDLATLTEDHDSAAEVLTGLSQDAAVALTACQAGQ